MKRLLLIIISCTLILLLTSCELLTKPEEKEEEKIPTPTEGIKYEISGNGEYAIAVRYDGTDNDIHFLKTYEGVPVTHIGAEAFIRHPYITSVTIHSGIEEIEGQAFYKCGALTNLTFEKNSTLKTIGDYAFYETELTSVNLPESVERIGALAFGSCLSLNNITIPSDVLIFDNAFQNTGYYNNEDNWENSVLYLGTHLICVKLEYKGEVIVKEGTTTIAGSAFCYRDKVTKVVIPDSVTTIGEMAFYQTDLDEIILSKNLTYIGFQAFYSSHISSGLIIPKSLKTIEHDAFRYASISRVFYEGTKIDWNNIEIGSHNDVFESLEKYGWFYYYSETAPTGPWSYWHYDKNGKPTVW